MVGGSFHESLRTVAPDLKRSSSPSSIVACVDFEEPSKSDERPMACVLEVGERRRCGGWWDALSDHAGPAMLA